MLSLPHVWRYEWLLLTAPQPPKEQKEIDKATFVAMFTAHLNSLKGVSHTCKKSC